MEGTGGGGVNWWPFVSKWTFEKMRRENGLLRDALRNANAELHRHKMLIADLRMGQEQATVAVQRAFAKRST